MARNHGIDAPSTRDPVLVLPQAHATPASCCGAKWCSCSKLQRLRQCSRSFMALGPKARWKKWPKSSDGNGSRMTQLKIDHLPKISEECIPFAWKHRLRGMQVGDTPVFSEEEITLFFFEHVPLNLSRVLPRIQSVWVGLNHKSCSLTSLS